MPHTYAPPHPLSRALCSTKHARNVSAEMFRPKISLLAQCRAALFHTIGALRYVERQKFPCSVSHPRFPVINSVVTRARAALFNIPPVVCLAPARLSMTTAVMLAKRALSPSAEERSGSRRRRVVLSTSAVCDIRSPSLSPDQHSSMVCAESLSDDDAESPRLFQSAQRHSPEHAPCSSMTSSQSAQRKKTSPSSVGKTPHTTASTASMDLGWHNVRETRVAQLWNCDQAREYLHNLASVGLVPGFEQCGEVLDGAARDVLQSISLMLSMLPTTSESVWMFLRTALLWLDGEKPGEHCAIRDYKIWHRSHFFTLSNFSVRSLMHAAATSLIAKSARDYVVVERDTCFLAMHTKWTAPRYCRPSPRTLFEVIVASKERRNPRYGTQRYWNESSIDTVMAMMDRGIVDVDVILFLRAGAIGVCPEKDSIMYGRVVGLTLQPENVVASSANSYVTMQCLTDPTRRVRMLVPVALCKIEGLIVVEPPKELL